MTLSFRWFQVTYFQPPSKLVLQTLSIKFKACLVPTDGKTSWKKNDQKTRSRVGTRKKSMQSRTALVFWLSQNMVCVLQSVTWEFRVQGFQNELWHTALTWCCLVKQCHWDSGPSWITWEENWMTWEENFCTEKLLHTGSFCTASLCTSYTEKLLHKETFTQSKLLHRETSTHSKLLHSKLLHILHREALARRSFYTASFCAEKLLHKARSYREKLLHREAFTHSKLLHRQALARGSFAQSKLLHTASFCTEKLLHKASSYTEKLLHREAFIQSKLLHREAFTQSNLLCKEPFTHSELLHKASFCT